jgi:hypothetical protein
MLNSGRTHMKEIKAQFASNADRRLLLSDFHTLLLLREAGLLNR